MARGRTRASPPTAVLPRRNLAPARVMEIGRPVTIRRPIFPTFREIVNQRLRTTRLDVARVMPRVVTATVTKRGRLLGVDRSPKQRIKLCKCHSHRSEAQREVSRRFFGSGGGRDRSKRVHACQC